MIRLLLLLRECARTPTCSIILFPKDRLDVVKFTLCAAHHLPNLANTSDMKIGNLVITLSGTWRYGVSAMTGWPGFTVLPS